MTVMAVERCTTPVAAAAFPVSSEITEVAAKVAVMERVMEKVAAVKEEGDERADWIIVPRAPLRQLES